MRRHLAKLASAQDIRYGPTCGTVATAAAVEPMESPWPGWVERAGWTLVHSVWQLAAVALFAALVRVPVVIGYLRPVILLPAGVVIGLTLDVKLLGR